MYAKPRKQSPYPPRLSEEQQMTYNNPHHLSSSSNADRKAETARGKAVKQNAQQCLVQRKRPGLCSPLPHPSSRIHYLFRELRAVPLKNTGSHPRHEEISLAAVTTIPRYISKY